MRHAFLNAVWQYHRDKSSEQAEVEACKEMLEHIKTGDLEKAAIAAGKTVGSLAIWELALKHQEEKQ